MTKKNARKTAARARQEKTGQKYESALRAEGASPNVILSFLQWVRLHGVHEGRELTYTDNEILSFLEARAATYRDQRVQGELFPTTALLAHAKKELFQKYLETEEGREKLLQTFVASLERGEDRNRKPDNIIRRRHEGLVRMFEEALDQCAASLDENKFPGAPRFLGVVEFEFQEVNQVITAMPEHDLKEPVPNVLGPVARDVEKMREMQRQGVTTDSRLQGPMGDAIRAERAPLIEELKKKGRIREGVMMYPDITNEERDNLVAEAIREMGPEEFGRRLRDARHSNREKQINDAFSVLNNGLYHRGHNSPTREDLYGRIQHALHILTGSSEETINEAINKGGFTPPPVTCSNCGATMVQKPEHDRSWWACPLCNAHRQPGPEETSPGGFTPKKPLEGFKVTPPPLRGWGLDLDAELPLERLPKDTLDKKPVYEKFYATDPTPTVKHNVEPQKLMDYWKPLPEAKRCTDSKQLRMGVTDDHPEKPLITWTSLARSKDCPGFTEWWHALPEAKPYDRASQAPFYAMDERGPWHDKTEFNISPGDLEATWVEVSRGGKVQDSGLIRKFKSSFPAKLPKGEAKVHVEFRTANGTPWGQPHDLLIDAAEVLKGRFQTIQRAYELLRKELKDAGKSPDPNDIRSCYFAIRPV